MDKNAKETMIYPLTAIFFIIVIFVGIFMLSVFVFQYAWNHTLTILFKAPIITFVQALLMLILISYLHPPCTLTGPYEFCKKCMKLS